MPRRPQRGRSSTRAGWLVVLVWLAWAMALPLRAHAAAKQLEGVVNLNTAPPELLLLLPGLGPAKVETILLYRRKHPFHTVDELGRVKGIGRRMIKELRAHLAVAGPSTASVVRVKTDLAALQRIDGASAAPRPAASERAGPVPSAGRKPAPDPSQDRAGSAGRVTSRAGPRAPLHLERGWRADVVPCPGPP